MILQDGAMKDDLEGRKDEKNGKRKVKCGCSDWNWEILAIVRRIDGIANFVHPSGFAPRSKNISFYSLQLT